MKPIRFCYSFQWNTVVMRCLLVFILILTTQAQADPYDEKADARQDIAAALKAAQRSGKFVLLDFGANWCPDCRVLSAQMQGDPLKTLVDKNFIVVMVDIGEGEKNADLVSKYGNVTERGIPSIVIVNGSNAILVRTLTGQLANARHMGGRELYDFFTGVVDRAQQASAAGVR